MDTHAEVPLALQKVWEGALPVEQDSGERILTALHVLTALYETEKKPSHTAVEALRRLAEDDQERLMAPDDLACLIIKREVPHLKFPSGVRIKGGTE
jgi:hypothetical protein